MRIKNRYSKRLTLKKIEQQKIILIKIRMDKMRTDYKYYGTFTYDDAYEIFKFQQEVKRRIERIVSYDL